MCRISQNMWQHRISSLIGLVTQNLLFVYSKTCSKRNRMRPIFFRIRQYSALWKSYLIRYMSYLGFTTPLTSQVISVAFYSEREKSDKFCSDALIYDTGPTNLLPFRRSSEKIHRPRPALKPRTSDPVASVITTGTPVSTQT